MCEKYCLEGRENVGDGNLLLIPVVGIGPLSGHSFVDDLAESRQTEQHLRIHVEPARIPHVEEASLQSQNIKKQHLWLGYFVVHVSNRIAF